MRIGIPAWQSRMSPVLDVAGRLLVVDVENGKEVARSEHTIVEAFLPRKVQRLCELGVEVLVCGAISRPLACLVAQSGIALVPWVAGDVEEVLRGYLGGRLSGPRFLMPGAGHCRRRRGGRRRGRFEQAMPGPQALPQAIPFAVPFAERWEGPEKRPDGEAAQNTRDS